MALRKRQWNGGVLMSRSCVQGAEENTNTSLEERISFWLARGNQVVEDKITSLWRAK